MSVDVGQSDKTLHGPMSDMDHMIWWEIECDSDKGNAWRL